MLTSKRVFAVSVRGVVDDIADELIDMFKNEPDVGIQAMRQAIVVLTGGEGKDGK